MNIGESGQIVRILEFGWSQKFPAEMALIYVESLRSLPFKPVKSAVEAMLRTEEFRPSVAAICRSATNVPNPANAVLSARRWLEYQEQLQFANGSGWVPVRPEVHTLVIEACAGLSVGMFGWENRFKAVYENRVDLLMTSSMELEK